MIVTFKKDATTDHEYDNVFRVSITLSNGSTFDIFEPSDKKGMLRVSPDRHNIEVRPLATNAVYLREYSQ